MEKKKPRLVIRPLFDPPLVIVESLLAAVVGAVVCTFLVATFFFILLNMLGLGWLIPTGILYNGFFLVGIVGAPAAYYEMKKAAYRRTAFLFYDDFLEYQDFRFLVSRRRGRVPLLDINDVFEDAGVLQTRRLLTTIYIAVPRMPLVTYGLTARSAFSGLRIPDVREDGRHADQIIALIQESAKKYLASEAQPQQAAPAPQQPLPPQQHQPPETSAPAEPPAQEAAGARAEEQP